MRLFRPFFFTEWIYPGAVFRIKTPGKLLYLTFDDGPDPVYTPQITAILNRYGIKAVFFWSGKSAEAYPGIVNKITEEGNLPGNHGYSHPDGWSSPAGRYVSDISMADAFTSAKLFRPPYGHLTPRQFRILKKKYRIFFWDLMPYDFDSSFSPEKCLNILKKKIRPGCVIVLHDTAGSCAVQILEEFIIFALQEGYRFGLP